MSIPNISEAAQDYRDSLRKEGRLYASFGPVPEEAVPTLLEMLEDPLQWAFVQGVYLESDSLPDELEAACKRAFGPLPY